MTNELHDRLSSRLGALTAAGMFDPNQHPRGQDGRYITIGGTVQTTNAQGQPTSEGKVTSVDGGVVTIRDTRSGVARQVPAAQVRQAPVREATIAPGHPIPTGGKPVVPSSPSKHLIERRARLDHAAAHHRADLKLAAAMSAMAKKYKKGTRAYDVAAKKLAGDHAAAHHAADLAYQKATGHPISSKPSARPEKGLIPNDRQIPHRPADARHAAVADARAGRAPSDHGDPKALYAYTQAYTHERQRMHQEAVRRGAHAAAHKRAIDKRLAAARKRAAKKKHGSGGSSGGHKFVRFRPTNPVTPTKAGKVHLGT